MQRIPRPRKVVLDSGATLLYQSNPGIPTTAAGVRFGRGSRDERPGEEGYSHLLEHMVFRGTGRRDALRTALDLERIGGQWDAFTSREAVCFNARVLDGHFGELADILGDIILDPRFPDDAFRLERRVIQEEIRSVRDAPEEAVHELFFDALFDGHPLGGPVAGRIGAIRRASRERLIAFHRRRFTGGDAQIGVVGNVPLGRVVEIVERCFPFPSTRRSRPVPLGRTRRRRSSGLNRADWSQVHLVAGNRTVPVTHPDRAPLVLLSWILGGGVSSRLFQAMRERAGLAYSVFAQANFWRDAGAFAIACSVDPRNLARATDIVREELVRLLREGITADEMASARAQITASIYIGAESAESRLFRLFNGYAYHGRYRSPAESAREIERTGRDRVIEAAERYLSWDDLSVVAGGAISGRSFRSAGGRRR